MYRDKIKATFYLDPELYRVFKVKAALNGKKLSAFMNEILEYQLHEDRQDVSLLRQKVRERGRRQPRADR